MNIAIITPSSDMVHADFASCLARLCVMAATANDQIAFINPRFSTVGKARWDGVRQALRLGADKVLFIDSDQTFPAHGLTQLIASGKKIVGGVSTTRTPPIEDTPRDAKGGRIDFHKRRGLHQVTSNGFAFTLIDADVFKKVEEPWFGKNGDSWYACEDEMFCHEAMRKGYKIWVDAGLRIGHLGLVEHK